MNTIIMNQDIHTPAFIKADASNKTDKNKQQPTSPKQVRRFSWTRFIELAILLSIVIGVIWLISKMVEKPLYFAPFGQIAFAPVGHNIIALCKVLVQGSILFYPFRYSGFS